MEIQRYNILKTATKRVQSRTRSSYTERRKSRTQFNISTASRWMTNRSALCDACQSKKVQPSVEPLDLWSLATNGTQELYEIARHLDVDVKELLVSSK